MENASLSIINDDNGNTMVAALTTARDQFCSLVANTPEEKMQLFNLINAPDKRVKDMINVPLPITDIYAETVECVNEATGEIQVCPRIVLIDDKGNSYQCVSKGMLNALSKMFQIYGLPHWNEPITIIPKLISKGDRNILTFTLGDSAKKK